MSRELESAGTPRVYETMLQLPVIIGKYQVPEIIRSTLSCARGAGTPSNQITEIYVPSISSFEVCTRTFSAKYSSY